MLDAFIATYRHRSCSWVDCLLLAADYQQKLRQKTASGCRSDAELLQAGIGAIETWASRNVPAFMYEELCEVLGCCPRSKQSKRSR